MKLNALFLQQEKELFLLLAAQPAKTYFEIVKKDVLKRLNKIQDAAFQYQEDKQNLFAIFEHAHLEINSEFRRRK